MYVAAGASSYERGRGGAFRGLTLPTYPAEGTICRSNCRCRWDITETDAQWECYWQLGGAARNCATCTGRASEYAPYVQQKG